MKIGMTGNGRRGRKFEGFKDWHTQEDGTTERADGQV
jgi:hypothetical protein